MKTDHRRYGVIEVCRLSGDCVHLTIDGELWSEVEWSASRQSWCVQDAAGQCLASSSSVSGHGFPLGSFLSTSSRIGMGFPSISIGSPRSRLFCWFCSR
jgi:hypothetical protein